MSFVSFQKGNHVFRYFLAWLRLEFRSESAYEDWLDEHISVYFAVGAPFLGSSSLARTFMSGRTMGLPITEVRISNSSVLIVQCIFFSHIHDLTGAPCFAI